MEHRIRLAPGLGVLCYVDDTLVTTQGSSYQQAARLATDGTILVVGRIQLLGLRASVEKSEALLFYGPRWGPPRAASIAIEGVQVPVRAQMKYLGLVLDGR